MKNKFTEVYLHTILYTQLTLTLCTNINLQGYMYTHHAYTTHIGIHTPTPINTHTHTHIHTHKSTQLYIIHIKSYKTHNLTNCFHDSVYILNITSDSSLKNSWAAYGPGNSNRLEIVVID